MSSRFLLSVVCVLCCFISVLTSGATNHRKQKRQLFREHVLPQQGGKIPDSAFIPERLTLNKLNQNGFYTIDGLVLEQKSPDIHHNVKKYPAPTIKLNLPPDNRNVAYPGRTYTPRVIDTTYIIREPIRFTLHPHHIIYFHQLPIPPRIKYIQRRPNEIFSNAGLQIFKEFQPFLKTLHSYD